MKYDVVLMDKRNNSVLVENNKTKEEALKLVEKFINEDLNKVKFYMIRKSEM